MTMLDYAKREIDIAKEIEKQDLEEGEFDYGGACYDSALKAFESLTRDGHSGFSIGITQRILNRLIDGKPLTPIEDTDDIWNEVSLYNPEDRYKSYQCKRLHSLFKYVYEDGRVIYKDIDSFYCVDLDTDTPYHSGLVQEIMNEMNPITMPYMPADTPIRVYCDDFLTDPKNGDFDTVGVLYFVNPDGVKVIIDRYFKEEGSQWAEISPEEYIRRYKRRVVNGEE